MSELDKDPYEHAAEKGCVVVLPQGNELFVDIDDQHGAEGFFRGAAILSRIYDLSATAYPSPSGEPWHYHVRVLVNSPEWDDVPLDEQVRIALQCMLGSDLQREALSWLRVEKGYEPVTVFFEKPPVMVNP